MYKKHANQEESKQEKSFTQKKQNGKNKSDPHGISSNHKINNFKWVKVVISKEITKKELEEHYFSGKIKETSKSYILYLPKVAKETSLKKIKSTIKEDLKRLGIKRIWIYILDPSKKE